MKKKAALVALTLAFAGGAAGCGSEHAVSLGPPPSTAAAPERTGSLPQLLSLQVWFARRDRLLAVRRTLRPTSAVATAAVTELLRGPTRSERAAGVGTAVPAATRLLGISIHGDVATVDLSSEFQAGGSSRALKLRLGQVVYTLTQFPTVRAVRFRLDGTPIDVVTSGGAVVARPVGRPAYAGLERSTGA
jgi:germination protein M